MILQLKALLLLFPLIALPFAVKADDLTIPWRDLTLADTVIVGHLAGDETAITAAITLPPRDENHWLQFTMTSGTYLLTQKPVREQGFYFWAGTNTYMDAAEMAKTAAMLNSEVIALVINVQKHMMNTWHTPIGPHIAALFPYNPDLAQSTRKELAQQQDINTNINKYLPLGTLPLEQTVKAHINNLANPVTAAAAFQALYGLGTEAVPALVAHMEDWRAFPLENVEIKQNVIHIHYPKTVMEAIATLLYYISGEKFMMAISCQDQQTQSKVLKYWRLYIAYESTVPARLIPKMKLP